MLQVGPEAGSGSDGPWQWLALTFAGGFFSLLLVVVKGWFDSRRTERTPTSPPTAWDNVGQLVLHRLTELERAKSMVEEEQRLRRMEIHSLKAKVYLLRKGITDGVLDWPEEEE